MSPESGLRFREDGRNDPLARLFGRQKVNRKMFSDDKRQSSARIIAGNPDQDPDEDSMRRLSLRQSNRLDILSSLEDSAS
jgi:hypothetical protein